MRQFIANIKPEKMLEEATILRFITFVCLGLHHMHINNIIHRDIKPENLLLFNGVIKIGDFGIARTFENHTRCKTLKAGSLEYMAPELLDSYSDNYLPKTTLKGDVWSVGVILYELCMIFRPF